MYMNANLSHVTSVVGVVSIQKLEKENEWGKTNETGISTCTLNCTLHVHVH